MVKTYVSKPREIQAIQYTVDNFEEVKNFVNTICASYTNKYNYLYPSMLIDFGGYCTLVRFGEYVFKDRFGNIVTARKDDFEAIYEIKK